MTGVIPAVDGRAADADADVDDQSVLVLRGERGRYRLRFEGEWFDCRICGTRVHTAARDARRVLSASGSDSDEISRHHVTDESDGEEPATVAEVAEAQTPVEHKAATGHNCYGR